MNENDRFIIASCTRGDILDALRYELEWCIGDEELPEGTTLSLEDMTDEVCEKYAEGMLEMYERGGSDDIRSEYYRDALRGALRVIFGGKIRDDD